MKKILILLSFLLLSCYPQKTLNVYESWYTHQDDQLLLGDLSFFSKEFGFEEDIDRWITSTGFKEGKHYTQKILHKSMEEATYRFIVQIWPSEREHHYHLRVEIRTRDRKVLKRWDPSKNVKN